MRVLLRLLSPVLGLALAAAGGLVALEAGWALARPDSRPLVAPWTAWRDQLSGFSWADTPVLVIGAALVLAGLLLLWLAGSARRHDVAMSGLSEDVTVVTSPRSLARIVGHRVRTEDGVRSASVTASPRRVRVRATSALNSETELRPTLISAVNDLVGTLPLAHTPRIQVVVDSPKDRR